jgi:hypothetical protein
MEDRVESTQGVAHRRDRLRAAWRACERLPARSPLRFSLLAILALLAFSVVAFQFSYDTNDDVFMTMIVAGQGISPAPDEHLVFTNVIIGHVLKWLYTACPIVPWYGCYLLLVHYAAQVLVLYCALTVRGGSQPAATSVRSIRWRFGLYLIYFALVELPFINNLQFTTTAFLAAQAGIFLLLLAVQRGAERPWASVGLPLCGAVLLVVVAGLVRFESLTMALLVAIPLGFIAARQASRRSLVCCGAAVGVAAMLITLATAYDRASYENDPRWRGFLSFNQLRVKFNDYKWTSYTPQTAHLFSAVGWTQNDHEMIAHWFFDDPVLYSEARLRSILEAHPWKAERFTRDYLWQVCKAMLRDRSVLAVMLALPFFLAVIDRRRNAKRTLIGCAVAAVALVAFLTWNCKVLPARVYFPILSFPLAAALLFPPGFAGAGSPRDKTKDSGESNGLSTSGARQPVARLVVVLLIVGIVMGVYHQCRRSVLVHEKRRALQTYFADMRRDDRKLYVSWEATLPFELVSPLDNLTSWSRLHLLSLAWTQRTPWQEEMKRRFGISNLAQAMCERDDIVLVATPIHRSLFVTFAKEHFQADVEFVPVASVGEKIEAGRFERRARHAETADKPSDALQR